MKTRFFFTSLIMLLFFTAGQAHGAAADMERKPAVPIQGRYYRMADNFFIIYDPSSAMDVPYKDTGLTRLEAQKRIIVKSNAGLPDLGWQAGLYGHWKGGLWLQGALMGFHPYYELKRYDNAAFGRAVDKLPVKPAGPPMLQRGLMKLDMLLGLPGRTEVFLFSDGKHSTIPELETDPLEQAEMLAKKYDFCFTVISSASTKKEKKLLDNIGAVNGCSQVIDFDTVYEKPEHLFGRLYLDEEQMQFDNILFDLDKHAVKHEYKPTLLHLARLLREQPKTYAVVSGFCDSQGAEAYNQKLSRKRAESVRKYLIEKFDISEDRVLPYWYGYANPVASNATEEGRALNRRVTIAVRVAE